MKKFEINGKQYPVKPITFDALCELEDMGFIIDEIFEKPRKGFRAYFAYCGDMNITKAGAELEAHLMSGKDVSELSDAFSQAIKESGFFHALTAKTDESNQTSEGEKEEERAEKK